MIIKTWKGKLSLIFVIDYWFQFDWFHCVKFKNLIQIFFLKKIQGKLLFENLTDAFHWLQWVYRLERLRTTSLLYNHNEREAILKWANSFPKCLYFPSKEGQCGMKTALTCMGIWYSYILWKTLQRNHHHEHKEHRHFIMTLALILSIKYFSKGL